MFKSKFLKGVNLLDEKAVYTLSNGVTIPVIGFGTWQVKNGDETYYSVMEALKAGYRHIDTAEAYGNEESVGRAIKDSGIPREELFITTKLWNSHGTYDETKKAFEQSLKRLGLTYVDLYLIHWANPIKHRANYEVRNAEVYRAMEDLYFEGKIRAIGVSNFMVRHLESLLKTARVTPMVNQLFINPSDQQAEVVSFGEEHIILTEAYSPLGTGKIFEVESLGKLAAKYQKSIGQVVLRWSLEHGYLPLPKSVTPSRIKENLAILDFTLEEEDILQLDKLHGAFGLTLNPDEADF